MWQRIQTLYFILVIGLMTASILLPNAYFYNQATDTAYQFDIRGVVELDAEGNATSLAGHSPLTILFGIILVLGIYIIVSFKNRRKQLRLATINLFLIFIYILVLAGYIAVARGRLDAGVSLLYPASFPIIALILNYLGMRGVSKDEALIRSLDRLR